MELDFKVPTKILMTGTVDFKLQFICTDFKTAKILPLHGILQVCQVLSQLLPHLLT